MGMPRSCGCSSMPSGRTGCTRRSTWPLTPGCAAARCSGCGRANLDLEAGRLSVRQALVSIGYDVQVSDVKTETGRRTIDIDPGTVDVMKAWRIERSFGH